jgi:hypothetical protein
VFGPLKPVLESARLIWIRIHPKALNTKVPSNLFAELTLLSSCKIELAAVAFENARFHSQSISVDEYQTTGRVRSIVIEVAILNGSRHVVTPMHSGPTSAIQDRAVAQNPWMSVITIAMENESHRVPGVGVIGFEEACRKIQK